MAIEKIIYQKLGIKPPKEKLLNESTNIPSPDEIKNIIHKLITNVLSEREFTELVGIPPKKFFRYYLTLHDILYNSDGSLSKFARTYGIRTYDDLYQLLLKIKNEGFRKDHIIIGFEPIIKMAEVVIPKVIKRGVVNEYIPAMSFTLRTIAEIIDDLRILKKMFKIIQVARELNQTQELMSAGKNYK